MPDGFAASAEDDLLMMTADEPRTATFYRRESGAGDPPTTNGVLIDGVHVVVQQTGMQGGGGASLPHGSARFTLQAKKLDYVLPDPGDVMRDDRTGIRYSLDECHSQACDTVFVLTGAAEQ